MSPFERALVRIGAGGRASIGLAWTAAVAEGGNFTGTTEEEERLCSTQDLLCAAADAALDAAMLAQVFDAAPDAPAHAALLRSAAAGVTRLTSRALETHARDTGYVHTVWVERALEDAEFVMCDDRDELFSGLRSGGESVALARHAAARIHAALSAAPVDRMGVPGRISEALGAGVALFMIADTGAV
jgi:hypothetical protein